MTEGTEEKVAPKPAGPMVPLFLVALTIVWVLVTPYLALRSALATWHLYAEPASPAELAEQDLLATMATLCGLVLPLVGAVVAGLTGRKVVAWLFGAGLAVVLAIVVLLGVAEEVRRPPERVEPTWRGCQEHSGGDTRCPGG